MSSYDQEVRIPVERLDGSTQDAIFLIDEPRDYIQRRIRQENNFYERPLLDFLTRVCGPRPLFVDVGANIGNHSIFFAVSRGAVVVAFEPNLANLERLRRNIVATGGIEGQITTHLMAIGAERGHVRSVALEHDNTGGNRVVRCAENAAEAVPQSTIDSVLGDFPPFSDVIIKIDVEGMEVDVVRGMLEVVQTRSPVVAVEVQTDQNLVKIRNLLAPLGYVPVASFFKQATFVLATRERFAQITQLVADNAWDSARHYVHYCDLFRKQAQIKAELEQFAKLIDS